MSRPDPTDLLCQLRREERGPEAEQRLADLLAGSPEARLIQLALNELDCESQVRAGDDVLLAAISERAMIEAARSGSRLSPGVRSVACPVDSPHRAVRAPLLGRIGVRGRSRLALAVAAVVVMMCGLAYGLHATGRRVSLVGLARSSPSAPTASARRKAPVRATAPLPSQTPPAAAAPLELPRPAPAVSGARRDTPASAYPRARSSPSAAEPLSEPPPRSSAADLFSEANSARRSGREPAAVALYEQLLIAHPAAREAPPARLALAKLLRGQDPASSLAHFEILARSATPFRAEALWGIAGCARALGQSAREKQALTDLLREFPTSPYASTSRARLGDDSP